MTDVSTREQPTSIISLQVLDELGLQLASTLTDLPQASGAVAQPNAPSKVAQAEGGASDADADLMARLEKLRRE